MNILYKHFSSLYNRLRLIANRYRSIYKIKENDPQTTKVPKYFSGLLKTNYATRTDNFETESKSQTMPKNWFTNTYVSATQPCTVFPSTYGTWVNYGPVTLVDDVNSATNPVLYAGTPNYTPIYGNTEYFYDSEPGWTVFNPILYYYGNLMHVYGNFYEGEVTFSARVNLGNSVEVICQVDGNTVANLSGSSYKTYKFNISTGYHTILWFVKAPNLDVPRPSQTWINLITYNYITGTSRTPSTSTVWWTSGNSALRPPYLVQSFDKDLRRPYSDGENDNSNRTPVIEHQQTPQYAHIDMPPKVWDGKEGWETNQSTKFAIKDEDIKRMIDHTINMSRIVEPLDTKNQLPSLQTIKRDLDLTIEKGTVISKGSIESIEKIVDKILKVLDGYDSYYNDDDVCKIQCQISCQTGCLVACQSCNNGQCHDQKCGTH